MNAKKKPAELGSSSSSEEPIGVPKKTSAQLGLLSEESTRVDDQTTRGDIQPMEDTSSVKPLAQSSEQPPQDTDTVDVTYKIVWSDLYEYCLPGYVYFRYLIPPEKRSTGWFCIVAFHWQDVRAEFECVYHPTITLFDEFKPIDGTLKGGKKKIKKVELSMWGFADRGPDLNPKHAVYDDNGNRTLLAIMTEDTEFGVKLYGKMIREGDKESEVWLSEDERRRLRLPSWPYGPR